MSEEQKVDLRKKTEPSKRKEGESEKDYQKRIKHNEKMKKYRDKNKDKIKKINKNYRERLKEKKAVKND